MSNVKSELLLTPKFRLSYPKLFGVSTPNDRGLYIYEFAAIFEPDAEIEALKNAANKVARLAFSDSKVKTPFTNSLWPTENSEDDDRDVNKYPQYAGKRKLTFRMYRKDKLDFPAHVIRSDGSPALPQDVFAGAVAMAQVQFYSTTTGGPRVAASWNNLLLVVGEGERIVESTGGAPASEAFANLLSASPPSKGLRELDDDDI